MLLKAALNGNRAPAEHPGIPVSPDQIAADVEAAVSRGVGAVHVHPRARDGAESLRRADIQTVVAAVRERCPSVPIGISTGEWIESQPGTRLERVSEWGGLVDFASVNFHEDGAIDVARRLLELGIGVEAGLFHAGAVQVLVESGLAGHCLRLMFEPGEPDSSAAMQNVQAMEEVLEQNEVPNDSVLLHGYDATSWPLLAAACKRGYDTRIGFEDTRVLPDGRTATSNAQLIEAANELLALT